MTAARKVAVVGLGAVGGWVAARLAEGGAQVSAVARGEVLEALRATGLTLSAPAGDIRVALRAAEDADELGPQEIVVIAVKGPGLAAASRAVAKLLRPETIVLPMMNGVPWWFLFHKDPRPLASVDPTGEIARNIPLRHVVGCVVHAACAVRGPAHSVHVTGEGLVIGEPTGELSRRVQDLAALLASAGFDARPSERIQADIWYKLWGNMTMNPLSALTGATCDRILDDPLVARLVLDVMAEAAAVGGAIGCPITQSGEARNAVTRSLGAFRTSMLQDADAGRPLEIDALLAAPKEIAGRTGTPTPALDALLGVTRLFARTRGLYPAG